MATATIFFTVESETLNSHDLFVLGPDARIPPGARHVRAGIPIGAQLAALTVAVAEANDIRGRLPRGTRLVRNVAADTALWDLMRVDDFVLRTQANLILPPSEDAEAEFYAGNPHTAELVEGVNASPETKAAVTHRARAAIEAAAPFPPKRKVVAAAILREYHMYGASVAEPAPLSDDDLEALLLGGAVEGSALSGAELEAILGFGPDTEAVPAAAPAVARLPYKDFALGEPTDCLIKGLIHKYSSLDASKRICETAIRKWFAEDAGGPSLLRLKEFAERYHIPLRVYDVTGAEIHLMTRHNVGRPSVRPGLAMVAWNNHAYFFEKTLNAAPDFTARLPHDVEGLFDSRSLKKQTADGVAEEMTAEEEYILGKALALDRPNFSYEAEAAVCARNLMWTNLGVGLPATAVGWDMNKAYHTATMATSAQYPCLADFIGNQRIPVFTAMDDYHASAGAPFPHERLWDVTYFFIHEDCMKRLRGGTGHSVGRISNLIPGVEFIYMVGRGAVTVRDVIGWKTATYSFQEEKLRHWLESLDETAKAMATAGANTEVADEGGASTLKSLFALLNGLLGRSFTQAHVIALTAAKEADIDLLNLTHPQMEEEKLANGRTHLTMPMGERKYLHLNAKHIYSHVISRMNLFMMKLIDDITAASPDAVLLKIKVDAVVYDRPVKLPPWALPIFKPENPRVPEYGYGHTTHDPSALQARVQNEIDALVEKCVVYTGAPGTGKTTIVHKEHDYDVALAFSNVCARNLDHETKRGAFVKGETLHSGLGLYSLDQAEKIMARLKDKVLWVDEFSTVQSWIWSVLVSLLKRGLKVLILTGDPNQTPPVMEKFRSKSALTHALLTGGKRLATDHRNDKELIKLRDFILDAPEYETSSVIALLENLCATRPELSADRLLAQDLAAIDVHITHTNKLRLAINQMIVESRGLVFTMRNSVTHRADARSKINWTASRGLRLRARVSRKGQEIYKGAIYELLTEVTWVSSSAELRRIHLDLERAPEKPFTLPIKDFSVFELGYALTAHSSIGQTVRGQKLAIHQARQMINIDKSILYVAITRACRLSDIVISLEAPASIAEKLDALAEQAEKSMARSPWDDEPGALNHFDASVMRTEYHGE